MSLVAIALVIGLAFCIERILYLSLAEINTCLLYTSIVDAKVVRSVDPYLDKEALRVINTMPKWKPGMQRGKPVRVKFTVPVMFRFCLLYTSLYRSYSYGTKCIRVGF